MAQILDHNLTDTPIVDLLEVIAKAAALGQISGTDPEPNTAVDPQETTP